MADFQGGQRQIRNQDPDQLPGPAMGPDPHYLEKSKDYDADVSKAVGRPIGAAERHPTSGQFVSPDTP